jgi:hypothetical protein
MGEIAIEEVEVGVGVVGVAACWRIKIVID